MRNPSVSRALFAVAACLLNAGAAAEPAEYSFGVLSQRSVVLTAQYWNPILDYVGKKAGVRLNLRIARSAAESNDAIEKGSYDFVYSNTIFSKRMAPSGYSVILRPLDGAITGQIVTIEPSPVRNIGDLRGAPLGFPAETSFVAYQVPMDYLLRNGINVTPVFGGNQEGIMAQLKAGRVRAAAVNNLVMKSFAEREGLRYRVIWESPPFLNIPVAVHPRVPKSAAASVAAAFDLMDDEREGAGVLSASAAVIGAKPPHGFKKSSQSDYSSYVDFHRNTLLRDPK